MSDESSRRGGLSRRLAIAYVAGLVLAILCFRLVGEHSSIVALTLYLPRWGFALPLPLILGALLVAGERRAALLTMIIAGVLVLFPLMGFKVAGRSELAPRSIRLMSWNTYQGRIDNEAIRRKVAEEQPDIFVSQASAHRTKELFRADPAGYRLESDDEFFLATRFPVVEKSYPPPFEDDPNHRPNFVRYTLQTPLGLVDLFSVHPRSPRSGIEDARGTGVLDRLQKGDVPEVSSIARNTSLRRRQVEALIDAMHQAKHPVLVAGDTNLPTLSWLFHHAFGDMRDGFTEAGHGFGYSFPAKRTWLGVRIDRIVSDQSFRFLRFWTGTVIASDHLYVVAELTRESP